MQKALEIRELSVRYITGMALKDVSIEVAEGTIASLIGVNGAGKSTLLKAISGMIPVIGGEIFFRGHNITGWKPFRIVKEGIAQVPEGGKVFTKLTVLDNLRTGAYLKKDKAEIEKNFGQVFKHFPRLKERLKQKAGTLSGGERQMLAFGRAMMANPKVLLLDEPSLGLSPIMVRELFSIVEDIKREGFTILLVEQNAKKALQLADNAYVLQTGEVILQGKARELLNESEVKRAYLGG